MCKYHFGLSQNVVFQSAIVADEWISRNGVTASTRFIYKCSLLQVTYSFYYKWLHCFLKHSWSYRFALVTASVGTLKLNLREMCSKKNWIPCSKDKREIKYEYIVSCVRFHSLILYCGSFAHKIHWKVQQHTRNRRSQTKKEQKNLNNFNLSILLICWHLLNCDILDTDMYFEPYCHTKLNARTFRVIRKLYSPSK